MVPVSDNADEFRLAMTQHHEWGHFVLVQAGMAFRNAAGRPTRAALVKEPGIDLFQANFVQPNDDIAELIEANVADRKLEAASATRRRRHEDGERSVEGVAGQSLGEKDGIMDVACRVSPDEKRTEPGMRLGFTGEQCERRRRNQNQTRDGSFGRTT